MARSPFDPWLDSEPFRNVWIPVASSPSSLIGPPYINGMLAQADDPKTLLATTTQPGVGLGVVSGAAAGTIKDPPDFLVGSTHHLAAADATFWPFVRVIERPGGEREMEPLQQFLAYHAAWPQHTRNQRHWYRLHEGEEQMIARWSPDPNDLEHAGTLEILRSALLKYLFGMSLHFAVFFDVRADGSGLPDDWTCHGSTERRRWHAWNTSAARLAAARPQAAMHGVEILLCPREDPEPEADRHGVKFTVILDPDTGKPGQVSFPGEPNEMTVWGGAGRNNFLTPLYFRPAVLARYHADPNLYSVEPEVVRAWAGWRLQLALTKDGNYQAYLGDVAELPRYEQEHWARHTVVGDEIPESRWLADFYAEIVEGPSHRTAIDDLHEAVQRVNQVARDVYGYDLFPPVETVNMPKVKGLRVPGNEVSSFQQQLTALWLLLNDSLDSRCLTAGGIEKIEGAGTLKRLEALLERLSGCEVGGVREAVGVLFEIQTLRSHVGGVHDTSGADKTLTRLNQDDLPWDAWFVDIVERAGTALNFIEKTLSASRSA